MTTPFTPMMLRQRPTPFDGERWLFEPKWDGWRCLAVVRPRGATLYSRNGTDLTERFPTVAAAVAGLPSGTEVDGELVVLDGDGCPDFTALMRRRSAPCLLAFDLLAHAGRDLSAEPLEHRKERLAELVEGRGDPVLQNTEGIVGEGRALFEVIRARGMEGIVAKKLGSRYAAGRRTGAWVKVKVPGYAPGRSDWFRRARSELAC